MMAGWPPRFFSQRFDVVIRDCDAVCGAAPSIIESRQKLSFDISGNQHNIDRCTTDS